MKKLTLQDYQEIRLWMYKNARHIELARWQYYFENGSKEAVLFSLSFYQNEDGGFGHALEPDNWNPISSPYTTLKAINILDGIKFTDSQHSIVKGILKFLENSKYCCENGWFFNIPSNNNYAHAPWWTYDVEVNVLEGIGVTAELVAFIFRYAEKDSELYKKALAYTDIIIKKFGKMDHYGEMGIKGYCVLLNSIEQADLTWRFDCKSLKEVLPRVIHDSIEKDMTKWVIKNNPVMPSKYITSPESIYYKGNEEIISNELDYLIKTRPQKGVWDITWSWFENNEKFPKEFAISQNWWKAYITIDKINLLRNFNRLDEELTIKR